MEYIYSAMLLHSAGKKITEESIKKVFSGHFPVSNAELQFCVLYAFIQIGLKFR